MRDALLRGTIRPMVDRADVDAAEREDGRLTTVRALAIVADGGRDQAARVVLRSHVPAVARDSLSRRASPSTLRPEIRFDERGVAHPTRGYVAALPSAPPGSLRITFLVHDLPLCGGVISIVQLVRRFIAAGHDVRLVTESPVIDPEALNLWCQPLVYRDREHLIDAFPASDIVVATFWTTAHEYLPALRARYGFTSVYFIQDYEAWFYDETDYGTRRNVVRSYAAADHHIVKSRWLAELVGRHGVKCDVVPIGLDLGVFYPRAGRRTDRLRVVSGASLEPRRGLTDTVNAFARIHAAPPDVELVFFGLDDATMPALPFPHTNAGHVTNPNAIAELVSSCHVLVDGSVWQGFGRPGLEAMACGTVPVLTSVGGVSEYARHQENCLFVDPRDPQGLAAAVLRLLEDAALRSRLRDAGPTTASRFCHEIEAERHLALYARWLKARHG
jgi:glycosyltransferase involved in cell wall biosynthesis